MQEHTPNLTIAGRLLLAEIGVAILLSLVLSQVSLPDDCVVLAVWAFNLVPAWYFSKAAKQHGRGQLGYGLLAALGPPGGITAYVLLYGTALAARLDRSER